MVTREGLALGYEIFPGNTGESTTVRGVVETLEGRCGKVGRVWVMDRGMVSEETMGWMRASGRRYVVGTPKSEIRKHETEEAAWTTYIQLTEAEAAFRIQKSDLSIRPVWHQKTERVRAHIFVCFMGYVLWKVLEQWQSRARLGNSPRKMLEELGRIQSGEVILPTMSGAVLRLRCVARPEKSQQVILQHLGINLPHRMKVSENVVPTF